MATVSVVIPALNEEANIPATLASIPIGRLTDAGYEVEVLVVDNGSSDRTAHVAREHGARVIVQPVRGYGNAYKAGFANSIGEVIVTGDADQTYPFDIVPEALEVLHSKQLDFLSTNRMTSYRSDAMSGSHVIANRALTAMSRALNTGLPFQDSQSGMWFFRRAVWQACRVLSGGMPFSQELKVEAFKRGFRCGEIPIEYKPRGGTKKLRGVRDGSRVAGQLFLHRVRGARPLLDSDEVRLVESGMTLTAPATGLKNQPLAAEQTFFLSDNGDASSAMLVTLTEKPSVTAVSVDATGVVVASRVAIPGEQSAAEALDVLRSDLTDLDDSSCGVLA